MLQPGSVLLILCAITSVTACSVRVYLRVIIGRRFELLELSLLCALVMQLSLVGVQLRIFDLIPSMGEPGPFVQSQKLFFCGTFLYLSSLWGVKISICMLHIRLTQRFKRIHLMAVITLYSLLALLPFCFVVFVVACWPVERRWALPTGHQCGPIIHAWDFWTHFSIHLTTDLILCILPFPALLKVTETRLRIAVCGIYSLTIVALIVTIIRIILLATDIDNSLKRILMLTQVEVTVCIIIGVLPGISASFTRKYTQGASTSAKEKSKKLGYQQFSRLQEGSRSQAQKSAVEGGDIELTQSSHQAVVTADNIEEHVGDNDSTDNILDSSKQGITKVTHISIDSETR